jgi:hypothetical protein
MDTRQIQAEILSLLRDSPIVSDDVVGDVRDYVRVGEIELAFDTLCSWLFEDDLPISRELYERLLAMSVTLNSASSVERLDELVREQSEGGAA